MSLLRFTLDTNCVIDVEESRKDAAHIMSLARAHSEQRAEVAVVAMMASEKQRAGGYLEDFSIFKSRLSRLGLGHLKLALPLAYFDICFFDHCLLSSDEMSVQDRKIHEVLFPNLEWSFVEYCSNRGIDPNESLSSETHKWRNAKCDVQALWSHINSRADIFVTNDMNFHGKEDELKLLGAGSIMAPSAATAIVACI